MTISSIMQAKMVLKKPGGGDWKERNTLFRMGMWCIFDLMFDGVLSGYLELKLPPPALLLMRNANTVEHQEGTTPI